MPKKRLDKSQKSFAGPTNSARSVPSDAFQEFEAATTLWNAQNARALVYASALAYETADTIASIAKTWKFPKSRITVITVSDLQAVVLGASDSIVVAFRGTRPAQLLDWMVDFEILQSPFTKYFSSSSVGAVHDGFARLLARAWKQIQAEVVRLQDNAQSLWLTGHSLGGALAALATAAFTFSARMPVNGLYTFGQPRVGDVPFCTQCDSHFGDATFRFVNNDDIVTRVPPRIVPHLPLPEFYGHFGTLRYFDADGKLHADDNWWNSFLTRVDVGFEGMQKLLSGPIADHDLMNGYAAKLENYIASGAPLPS
ncbi:MAG TPA: lipase family protein [Terriglobales bacterium]|nr:lipase family protein [Terriglobales bacterium]